MQQNDKPVLVYSTFPSPEAAEETGRGLVELRMAACVNIIPGMTSIYRWQGELHRDRECVMLVKTRTAMAEAVVAEIRKRHAYENPALLILPIEGGSQVFLDWILTETKS